LALQSLYKCHYALRKYNDERLIINGVAVSRKIVVDKIDELGGKKPNVVYDIQ
jgi:hypothetical protein